MTMALDKSVSRGLINATISYGIRYSNLHDFDQFIFHHVARHIEQNRGPFREVRLHGGLL